MPGVVDTTHVFANNQVITSTLLNNIIDETFFTNDALANGTLSLTSNKMKVATGGITANEIATGAITETAIASNAITISKIADGNIVTSKIQNGHVTSEKLSNDSVTTEKIANLAVKAGKLDGAQSGIAPIYGVRAAGRFLFEAFYRGLLASPLNVFSVSRNSATSSSVQFTIAMPNANYTVVGNYENDFNNNQIVIFNKNQSGFSINHATESATRVLGFIVVG